MAALNPPQREAVTHLDSPLLVLAGAGSGKTRVITEKIAWLVSRGHLPADRIAAITFTNKAAREMRQRVGQRLDKRRIDGLTVSTFHSLGWQILRTHAVACGRRRGVSILDQHGAGDLVRELLPAGAGNDLVYAVQSGIGRYKDAGVSPEQAQATAADEGQGRAATLYAGYEERLARLNAVDFDDLIACPARLLEDDELRDQWQARYQYLLVDEYQDTSAAQYRLLLRLVGTRPVLTAVGDDDQSIYGWRGARPENLAGLRSDFPTLRVVKLEQNYRSSGKILRAANAVIAANPGRFDKRLWSELGPGDNLAVAEHADEADEAENTVREILALHHGRGLSWRSCAVLYRSNFQARAMERELREHAIPYVVSGGPSWFDLREIRDGLAFLRVLVNPEDNPAFLRIANTPRRGLGSTAMGKLGEFAQSSGLSLFEAAADPAFEEHVPPATGRSFRGLTNVLIEFNDRLRHAEIGSVYQDLLAHLGYADWLAGQEDDPIKARRRRRNLDDLAAWVGRLGKETRSLNELVARVSLVAGPDDDRQEQADVVRLMTLHAAKGLEFDNVWLVGCEEGLLPHQRSIEADQVEEERRLMYVGITRAARRLVLSYCRRRRRAGEVRSVEPSRFLDELPGDIIDWPARTGCQTTQPNQARANIAALRAMLDD